MDSEIKRRIAQIRRGEVPEGYKKGKLGIVPEEWTDTSFSTLFTSTSDYTDDLDKYPLYSLTIEEGVTPKTERYERSHLVKKEDSYKIVRPNDYAYNPMNLRFGAVARHKGNIPVAVSGYYDIFTTVCKSDLPFMDSFLICTPMITHYNKVSTGSLIEKQRVHFSQFLEFVLPLPSIKERAQIAAILTTQGKVIELKEKRLAEKLRQKKYLMQQLLTGRKRLPSYWGEWNFPKAKEIFQNVTDKNHKGDLMVLSATQDKGIMPRNEVDIDIKYDVSSLANYKKVCQGNFVISLRSFQGGIEYSAYTGLVSPAYTVLSSKKELCDEYYKQYFKSADFINRLNVAVYGIRDGKQISFEDFGQLRIPYPPINEQTAIAQVLSTADREISLLRQDIEQEKQKKKALMQLLLTGIVRVKI